MLSSLTSFLPSVLQMDHHQKSFQNETDKDLRDERDEQTDDEGHTDMGVDDMGVKKKKDKTANETFIFVRPPPAKSNHPLNLQVQLVPPNTRAPGVPGSANSRQSLDFTPGTSPTTPTTSDIGGEAQTPTSNSPLSRTTSNRSEASMYSSVTSFSSVSTSSGSGRRMIIPLYNLQAHNVMTNVIVDAGTDAKIAKFTKRGIELIDLAVLEPIEVWGSTTGRIAPVGGVAPRASIDSARAAPGTLSTFSTRSASAGSGLLQPGNGGRSRSRPTTPDTPASSHVSISSGSNSNSNHNSLRTPTVKVENTSPAMPAATPSGTPTPNGSKRNIFGKMFKRKDATTSSSHTRSPSVPDADLAHLTPHLTISKQQAKRASTISSDTSPPPEMIEGLPTSNSTSSPSASNMLRPPILGIQPTLSSSIFPPRGRPTMYVWIVRRWLKGGDGGILGGMIGKLGGGSNGSGMGLGLAGLGIGSPNTPVGIVEVRFEWKRRTDKKKKSKKVPGSAQGSRRASLLVEKRSNTSLNNGASPARDPKEKADKERKTNNRLSTISHRSVSTTITSEDHPDTTPKDDEGEDSDPEDSETPWTCTLRMRRLPPPSTPRMLSARTPPSEKEKEKDQRIKVGTLSPTPHHPKVVAMLKIPFPLPDLDVEKMVVKRRIIGANGVVLRPMGNGEGNGGLSPVSESGERHGLMLTAEEIKDVVSSTGLWLVVREGFGGVGRVNRKGDGWRIRA